MCGSGPSCTNGCGCKGLSMVSNPMLFLNISGILRTFKIPWRFQNIENQYLITKYLTAIFAMLMLYNISRLIGSSTKYLTILPIHT